MCEQVVLQLSLVITCCMMCVTFKNQKPKKKFEVKEGKRGATKEKEKQNHLLCDACIEYRRLLI